MLFLALLIKYLWLYILYKISTDRSSDKNNLTPKFSKALMTTLCLLMTAGVLEPDLGKIFFKTTVAIIENNTNDKKFTENKNLIYKHSLIYEMKKTIKNFCIMESLVCRTSNKEMSAIIDDKEIVFSIHEISTTPLVNDKDERCKFKNKDNVMSSVCYKPLM